MIDNQGQLVSNVFPHWYVPDKSRPFVSSLANRCDFLISSGRRKNSVDGSVNLDGLTKGFVKARNASGIEFSEQPPTFHEIRSLVSRLYEAEHGKEFTQKLLGHTTQKMTEKYLDSRKKEFMLL